MTKQMAMKQLQLYEYNQANAHTKQYICTTAQSANINCTYNEIQINNKRIIVIITVRVIRKKTKNNNRIQQ